MAEKMSMLIVQVDLDCHKCYDKMRKILCKLQDQEGIRTISFDDKSKTVAIAGPFDPQRLACKIRCRGGKTVRDIQIVDVGGGGGKPPPTVMVVEPPPPVKSDKKKKKKHKGKAPAAEPPTQPAPEPEPATAPPPRDMMPPHASPPHHQPGTPDRGVAATMPPFHEEDRPMAQPAQLEPPPLPSPREKPPPIDYYMPPPALPQPPPPAMHHPRPPPCPKPPRPEHQYPPVECVIPTVEIPSWPVAPAGPCGCPCCTTTSYQGYYEGCRCGCGGGRVYPAAGYRGCRIINEEDPNAACSIM